MRNKFLKLYKNCVLVKGVKRSLLCDLQNEISYYVPSDISHAIDVLQAHSIAETKELNLVSAKIIDSTIEFIVTNNLGHLLSRQSINKFPDINLEWDYPAEITNCIIDINRNSDFDFSKIFLELESLGCQDLQLRIEDSLFIHEIENILKYADGRMLKSIQLYVANNSSESDEGYIGLVAKFPRITNLFVFNSLLSKVLTPDTAPAYTVARIADRIDFKRGCGIVHPDWFVTTMEHFTESLKFNTCLNRKISIDENGVIRNCPSLGTSFGNVKSVTLTEVARMREFRKIWKVTKSEIEICQLCEFRHICTDCRAFLEEPQNVRSKPLKCGYDPYTNQWSEWSKNPLKLKAMDFYELGLA
ncbi:MAG: grasp-with-spasm system SPASM domain peptide maturase [Bacteroidia bacterium]|nr:grasp-with-spasm system SPASM domain peptide maturase [Bacteroidia bacterium]